MILGLAVIGFGIPSAAAALCGSDAVFVTWNVDGLLYAGSAGTEACASEGGVTKCEIESGYGFATITVNDDLNSWAVSGVFLGLPFAGTHVNYDNEPGCSPGSCGFGGWLAGGVIFDIQGSCTPGIGDVIHAPEIFPEKK